MAADATPDRDDAPDVMTAEEVGELLRTHVITVYRMAESGQLPGFKVGTRWRFRRQAVEDWCLAKEEASRPWMLVVDDEPGIRSLFGEFGRLGGVGSVFAETGEQAVEACRGRRFSVVFLDLLLPGMDGVEVTKGIQKLQPDTPIVIMTGYPDHPLVEQARQLAPLTVLHKPFAFGEVREILQSIPAQRT